MKSNKCQITFICNLSVGFPGAPISPCEAKGSISTNFYWESVSNHCHVAEMQF